MLLIQEVGTWSFPAVLPIDYCLIVLMAPPIKPPDERFISFVKELCSDIESEDIANETWISKTIESITHDLPLIDITQFRSLKSVDELVKFIRNEKKIVEAVESLATKLVSLEQSKKYKSIKSAPLARRLLNEGTKLDNSKRYNAALVKLNEVRNSCAAILISII